MYWCSQGHSYLFCSNGARLVLNCMIPYRRNLSIVLLTDIRQRHYIQISVWSKPDILRIMLPVCSDSWLCWQRHRHPFGSYIGIRHLLLLHWSIFEMANRWELQKKCQDLNVILKRLNKPNGLNRWYCTSRLLLCPCTRFIYS